MAYFYECPRCGYLLKTVFNLSKEKGRITLCPKCRTKLVSQEPEKVSLKLSECKSPEMLHIRAYINNIRNPTKKKFAMEYMNKVLSHQDTSEVFAGFHLSLMAKQAVVMNINDYLEVLQ